MSRVAVVASNAVWCAIGVTLLVEGISGHRLETILLRASVVAIASAFCALAFLMLWSRFQAESPKAVERPAAAAAAGGPKPAQPAAPARAGR